MLANKSLFRFGKGPDESLPELDGDRDGILEAGCCGFLCIHFHCYCCLLRLNDTNVDRGELAGVNVRAS